MENSAVSKGGGASKFLSFLIVLGLIVLVVVLDMRRRDAEKKLMDLSMQVEKQQGNQEQNREVANQVIQKVRRIFVIPEGIDPTVATIVDVNQLRSRNAFYNKAKNGDHLIVTNDRAILYDPLTDKIIDVVPVQIQAPPPASAQGGTASKPASAAASSKK